MSEKIILKILLLSVVLTILFWLSLLHFVHAEEEVVIISSEYRGVWLDEANSTFEIGYNEPRKLSYLVNKDFGCKLVTQTYNGFASSCFKIGEVKKFWNTNISFRMVDEKTLNVKIGPDTYRLRRPGF